MLIMMVGLDKDLEQVYRLDLADKTKDIQIVAKNILKEMDHVHMVIACKAAPSIRKLDSAFMVNYEFTYLMGWVRDAS